MATSSAGLDLNAGKGGHMQDARLSLSEIISALSLALDLTEGALQGHALRSCLLGMRIAASLYLDPVRMHDLYFALLLKDVGCSSNAARMCQIVGGDDIAMKAGAKLEDWTKPNKPTLSTLKMLWGNVLPAGNPASRFARIVQLGLDQHKNNEELITLRCDRGSGIVRKLGLGPNVAEAVRYLDEHWDGSGYPDRLLGSYIPLLSRIMQVAQNLDVFSTERGPESAIKILLERRGTWFDPELVDIALGLHRYGDLWRHCQRDASAEETRQAVLEIEPGSDINLTNQDFDRICEAFADVVDAKSPFTYSHSIGVADAALGIAQTMGLPEERIQLIRRAALLHDIGKLGVSNAILDKPGKPTPEEWKAIRYHPVMTRQILARIRAFDELARVAGEHHEKLDGSGYPDGLTAPQLCRESRIIVVADIFGALVEDRSYRRGLPLDKAIEIIAKEVPDKLDGDCFEALLACAERLDRERHTQTEPICLPSAPSPISML